MIGDERIFSEDKTDCVGIVGQRNVDQVLKITNGANVETGVMELGRSSNNNIEVIDGSLTAVLIDGVVGSERVNANSGHIFFDPDVNDSLNSLVVGSDSSSASVNAKAIHNIASVMLLMVLWMLILQATWRFKGLELQIGVQLILR